MAAPVGIGISAGHPPAHPGTTSWPLLRARTHGGGAGTRAGARAELAEVDGAEGASRASEQGDTVQTGAWAEGRGGEVTSLLNEVVGILQTSGRGDAATAAGNELVKAAGTGDRIAAAHALSRLKLLSAGGGRLAGLVDRVEQVLRGSGLL